MERMGCHTTCFPVKQKITYPMAGTHLEVSSVETPASFTSKLLNHFIIIAATYRELAKVLRNRNYEQLQYSDWINENTTAISAYLSMLSLTRMEPPGKFQSTVKNVKVHYIAHRGLNGSDAIRLGGVHSLHLRGPTPARLVPGNVVAAVPHWAQMQQLPRFTRESQPALDRNNWRVRA